MDYVHFVIVFIIIIIICQSINHANAQSSEAENLFKHLFKLRRAEQLAAVKRIRNLDTEGKQKRMIIAVADKIFTMMKKNRIFIENSGFIPGVSDFPTDDDTKDALSNLLENTALMGEIILRLPDISCSLLNLHSDWKTLLKWSLKFANETKLLDEASCFLIDLVSQEMNFTVRSDDYINPYKKLYKSKKDLPENRKLSLPAKSKKKTKEKNRGPRMSSNYYGDL